MPGHRLCAVARSRCSGAGPAREGCWVLGLGCKASGSVSGECLGIGAVLSHVLSVLVLALRVRAVGFWV